jgi:membrane-associated phospholipid phosphatase
VRHGGRAGCRLRALFLLCGGLALPLGAQSVPSPAGASAPAVTQPIFTARYRRLAGVFAAGTVAISPLDQRLALDMQASSVRSGDATRRAARFFDQAGSPGVIAAGVGLYAVGRLSGQSRWAELGLRSTEAIVLSGWVTGGIKGLTGRARPYIVGDTMPYDFSLLRGLLKGEHFQSFPSGHTTAAFAFAAVMAAETSHWHSSAAARWIAGTVAYGGATMVGLARMYDERHWASDVVGGAAVGTLSGLLVVRYHRVRPGNRIDRWLLPAPARR